MAKLSLFGINEAVLEKSVQEGKLNIGSGNTIKFDNYILIQASRLEKNRKKFANKISRQKTSIRSALKSVDMTDRKISYLSNKDSLTKARKMSTAQNHVIYYYI